MKKTFLFFAFIALMTSSVAWSMNKDDLDLTLPKRTLIKIKNDASGQILSINPHHKTLVMKPDTSNNEKKSSSLWSIEMTKAFCKLKNFSNCSLKAQGYIVSLSDTDSTDPTDSWIITKVGRSYKITNCRSGNLLVQNGNTISAGDAMPDQKQPSARSQYWQLIPVSEKVRESEGKEAEFGA